MKVAYLFALLATAVAAKGRKLQYGAAAAGGYQGGNDDDDDAPSARAEGGYTAAAAAAPAYHAAAAAPAYHPVAAAAPAYAAATVTELHIHPACHIGGPTPIRANGEYRKLRADRTLFEDDLEEPYDDPGCGHGVCVLAPGGHGECICDAAFMTTETSGPCGQHQKSQGVAFLLQLFLGPFGAGAFYLGGPWLGTAIICLLFIGLGVCVAPIAACAVTGIFDLFCGWCNACNCAQNTVTVMCCLGVLHCAGLITWFVSLIVIGVDCKVSGIPCVPM